MFDVLYDDWYGSIYAVIMNIYEHGLLMRSDCAS